MCCKFRNFLLALVAFALPAALSLERPATAAQEPPPSAQSSSQNQSPSQAQTPAQEKQDSVAAAARKAKEKKAAGTKGRVFTEDDLSGIRKQGVSVVGDENTKRTKDTSATPASDADGDDVPNGEKYWRGKARPLLEGMAYLDQQMAQLKEDIKKYGNGGFDVTTGYKNSVAYVEDRNGQIEKLQKKKADLQKKLDELEEEGRKSGAEPAWFR